MNDNELFAFVLMPFDPKFDDLYKFGIKEPAAQLGIRAERVDEQIYTEGILERIYRQIERADIIIAEMTGQNANVFYEVGYAHGKGRQCILSTAEAKDIPFDLQHRRHIVHAHSIKILSERLKEELMWAKGQIENIQKSHIAVKLQEASGYLNSTQYSANATIDFKVDLLNDSLEPSPEIEAAYFYSTEGWTLSQDGKECPSTHSDHPTFSKRHFLTLPVRRLHKASWAQVRFSANKTLASVYAGDEIKSEYRISGWSILRLVTTDGNFDHELPIDVTVEEIPF